MNDKFSMWITNYTLAVRAAVQTCTKLKYIQYAMGNEIGPHTMQNNKIIIKNYGTFLVSMNLPIYESEVRAFSVFIFPVI